MADRGFKIFDDVAFYQAKLVIPDFTKGKKQLHPLEVENTRKIASVRIHVERVIGLVVRKFRIFDAEIPLEFLKLKQGETVPTIDKVVKVCCALLCLCPPIVMLVPTHCHACAHPSSHLSDVQSNLSVTHKRNVCKKLIMLILNCFSPSVCLQCMYSSVMYLLYFVLNNKGLR